MVRRGHSSLVLNAECHLCRDSQASQPGGVGHGPGWPSGRIRGSGHELGHASWEDLLPEALVMD